ncbi:MAG: prepilin-type N-terminal cleavage/methylation domain-containing protein [Lachnospiraceae bacterium]|nr:prepilin-type N-terminal cleavage/methylation domain-containing protein [Lachnospiraceae bacterium]
MQEKIINELNIIEDSNVLNRGNDDTERTAGPGLRLGKLLRDTGGFTLVELIVVLVIIAILAAAVGPAFLGYIDKVKKNGVLNDAKKVYFAAQSLSEQAHNDLVDPAVRVTAARVSEISGVSFEGVTTPYTIIYEKNSFNISNPENGMYVIKSFTYTDGTFTATYDKHKKSEDGDIWTVSE